MKKSIVAISVLLVACGGSETVNLDGGSDSGNPIVMSDGGNPNGDGGNPNNDSGLPGDDGGNVDGGSDTGGGFNVGSLSCLVLWLDAAKGVTQNMGNVSVWADQSGKGNDASQNINNRQPTLVMNGINSLPSLHFNQGMGNQQGNGNMLIINDSMSMQWGTGDFAVWVVARYNNIPNSGWATGSGTLFDKAPPPFSQQSRGVYLMANMFGQQGWAPGVEGAVEATQANDLQQGGMFNDNTARAYGFRRAGSTLELRVNGMALATKQQQGMVDVSAANQLGHIGAEGDANWRRLNGDIAEIIGCKGSISTQDLGSVDGYLKMKYNL